MIVAFELITYLKISKRREKGRDFEILEGYLDSSRYKAPKCYKCILIIIITTLLSCQICSSALREKVPSTNCGHLTCLTKNVINIYKIENIYIHLKNRSTNILKFCFFNYIKI